MFAVLFAVRSFLCKIMAPTASRLPAREVRSVGLAPFVKRIHFNVVYETTDGEAFEPSPQPLENLLDCPLLVFEYEVKRFKDMTHRVRSRGQRLMMRMKQPFPTNWYKELRCDRNVEYVPDGRERLARILGSTEMTVKEEVDEFYIVQFEFNDTRHLVRRAFVEYYFPIDLICYWRQHGLTQPEYCIFSENELQKKFKERNAKIKSQKALKKKGKRKVRKRLGK